MPELSTPSKEPTELIGWKRWDSPRRNLIPDPARGDNHNRSQTPIQRPYLGRQGSTHKYTQVSIVPTVFSREEKVKNRSFSSGKKKGGKLFQ
jgi:hypothetical protein